MWSWNQFRNLPKNQRLSPQEQARQYFIHQSNMMMEASSNNNSAAAASSAAAGAGAGGTPASRRVTVASWVSLYSALESLNLRYSEVTALVPNIYNFWDDYTTVNDDGDIPILTGIDDGGNDMYDGANYMNTNLTANWDDIKEGESDDDGDLAQASIPYTHTQASEASDEEDDDEEYNNPPMDGQVALGDSYFGPGSMYFTNMYPGLFIMIADNISVSEFNISGNVGSDGDGIGAGYVESIVPGWTLFYKTNNDGSDEEDPSINQLILVPGTSTGITQEYDTSSDYDDHRISGIDDRTRIIYAVVARQPEQDVLSEQDAVNVAQKILEIVGIEVPQPIEYNFDITADWSLATPNVIDEASFKTFLESGEDGDGSTSNLTDVVITDFLLNENRLRCNLTANGTYLALSILEVTNVNAIGNISGLEILNLINNQIVTFNPILALPDSLQILELIQNQIVTFNPSIALPSSLINLKLSGNQIVTFNPTIALPSGLQELNLNNNQIVTFNPTLSLPDSLNNLDLSNNQMTIAGYTDSEPWANSMSVIPERGILRFSWNVDSALETDLETILIAKGWNVAT